jgi:hypothetical protein
MIASLNKTLKNEKTKIIISAYTLYSTYGNKTETQ